MAIEDIIDERDSNRLELTQRVREEFIKDMVKRDPDQDMTAILDSLDKDEKTFLVKILDGLDKSILSKSKIKVEEQSNTAQREASKMISEVLARHTAIAAASSRQTTPELSQDIQVNDIVEGEMDIGSNDLNYENFTK